VWATTKLLTPPTWDKGKGSTGPKEGAKGNKDVLDPLKIPTKNAPKKTPERYKCLNPSMPFRG
jgi:hypothetical protein